MGSAAELVAVAVDPDHAAELLVRLGYSVTEAASGRAGLALEVRPAAHQPRRQMLQARKLHLNQQGVEYRVSAMIRRLGVQNRASLISKAYSLGVMELGQWPPRARRAPAG